LFLNFIHHYCHKWDEETVNAVEPAAKALGNKRAGSGRNGFSDPAQEALLAGNRANLGRLLIRNRDFRPEAYERQVRMG